MSDTQNQPVTIKRLRQRLVQVETAPMWQKTGLSLVAVTEAVDFAEQQEQRINSLEARLEGLETIAGIL